MKKAFLVIALLQSSVALAQSPAPGLSHTPDFGNQALSQKLLEEINANLEYRAALLAVQEEVKKLHDEITELKKQLPEDKK